MRVARIQAQRVRGKQRHAAERRLDTAAGRKSVKGSWLKLPRAIGGNDQIHPPIKLYQLQRMQTAIKADALTKPRGQGLLLIGITATDHMDTQVGQVAERMHGFEKTGIAFIDGERHVALGHETDVERRLFLAVIGQVLRKLGGKVAGRNHDTTDLFDRWQHMAKTLGKALQIIQRQRQGYDNGLQQLAAQHLVELGIAVRIVKRKTSAGIERQNEGKLVLLQVRQEMHRVIEEIDVRQPATCQPARVIRLHLPGKMLAMRIAIGSVLLAEVGQGGQDAQTGELLQIGVVFGHPEAGQQIGEKIVENHPGGRVDRRDVLRRLDAVAQRKLWPHQNLQGAGSFRPEVEDSVAETYGIVDRGRQDSQRVIAMLQMNGDFEFEIERIARHPVPGIDIAAGGSMTAEDRQIVSIFEMVGDNQLFAGVPHAQTQAQTQVFSVGSADALPPHALSF